MSKGKRLRSRTKLHDEYACSAPVSMEAMESSAFSIDSSIVAKYLSL